MYDPSGLYVDPILTNLSIGYPEQTFYGLSFLPETPVRTQSGQYRVFGREHWLLTEDRREPGTVAHEVRGAKWSQDVFSTKEHSLQSPVHDEERQELTSQGGLAQATFGGDLQLDPERDALDLVNRDISLNHEKKAADLIRNPANYGSGNKVTLAGSQQWNDYTMVTAGIPTTIVSDPVAAIMTGMRAVYAATGRWPNTLAIPTMGMGYIENHPRITARFSNFALTMDGAFQALTGFTGKIVPVDSLYNAANNLDATATMTSFWGKDVWLGIVDPTPGQRTFTFGKTFAQVYPVGITRPVERWREEARKSDLVRSNWKYDLKIVTASAGYLITNAFAASAF